MDLKPPFVWLEDRLSPDPGGLLFEHPVAIVRCDAPQDVGAALDRVEAGLAKGLHAAGVFAYDLGLVLEPRLALRLAQTRADPLIWLGLFPPPRRVREAEADAFFAARPPPPPLALSPPGHTRDEHVAKVRRLRELIATGDIYQANLTFPLAFRLDGDPLSLYAALRARQPVAHGGFAALGDTSVLSVSPELFLRIEGATTVSRPMKGTAARRIGPAEDAQAAAALLACPKQRAENLMIVDLVRNDLSRVSQAGSVKVAQLFAVETYPTFHALTSTVSARLRDGVRLRDVLAALFPCGSIVGAPKIRAAEVLADIEATPRGVYTGALGRLEPAGGLDLNVAIRTAVIDADGHGRYGVGGGVVADSDPDAEYDEALLKGRVLTDLARPYALIETLRWSPARGFVRLGRHLSRLAASAETLDFAWSATAAMRMLAYGAEAWRTAPHARRVRLVLERSGRLGLEHAPAPRRLERPVQLFLAGTRLDAGDPFLRHKTTRRDAYDEALAEAKAAGGDEAILMNRAGDIADGARRSAFLVCDGRLLTPPVCDGALPGVFRAALIASGRAAEASMTPADLATAEAVLVGNSLRGLQRAALGPPKPGAGG
jgi:para-aminobenzoate synthetase/4-amino-4-deoxychorismate lyase